METEHYVAEMAKFQIVMDKFYNRLTIFTFAGFISGFVLGAMMALWFITGR